MVLNYYFFFPEAGYLEPESHCWVQSSLAGKCFVCIVHKRKTRGHNYKQSLRHKRLSGTALPIAEDGFQISLKNREVVCVLGNSERGQGCVQVSSWAWSNAGGDLEQDLRGQVGRSGFFSALEEWVKEGMVLLPWLSSWEATEEMKLDSAEVCGERLELWAVLGNLIKKWCEKKLYHVGDEAQEQPKRL